MNPDSGFSNTRKRTEFVLVRDGTLFGPSETEIDFRTPDYSVWLTVKADSDSAAEAVAAALEARFGTEGGTVWQDTATGCEAGSAESGASPQLEVGAE